jgi:hypothetical protein
MNLVALLAQIEHGNILPVWMQGAVLHQWGPMVEIPGPPEKGCGWSSYGGIVVAVLDIRKDLIPCAWILGFVHAQDMHDHPIDDLCLPLV